MFNQIWANFRLTGHRGSYSNNQNNHNNHNENSTAIILTIIINTPSKRSQNYPPRARERFRMYTAAGRAPNFLCAPFFCSSPHSDVEIFEIAHRNRIFQNGHLFVYVHRHHGRRRKKQRRVGCDKAGKRGARAGGYS